MNVHEKQEQLKAILEHYGRLLVAFSGGVDSAFLLAAAQSVLKENVVAATGFSPIHSLRETRHAEALAKKLGVRHMMIPTRELELAEFVSNTENRCYVCKKNLILGLWQIAEKLNLPYIAHGANTDDLGDFRPGLVAAEELGVVSPLIEAGLAKAEIRELSREMGLETWDKPSNPCLATRLPYGAPITPEALQKIEAAENILIAHGMIVCRLRHHGDTARIETDEHGLEILLRPDRRAGIVRKIKAVGYRYVSLDLEGYTQGSMNRPGVERLK